MCFFHLNKINEQQVLNLGGREVRATETAQ